MIGIDKLITLSASHITSSTKEYLHRLAQDETKPVTFLKGECSWLIFIGEDEPLANPPNDLLKVTDFAHRHGCKWLVLDTYGQVIQFLPVYKQ